MHYVGRGGLVSFAMSAHGYCALGPQWESGKGCRFWKLLGGYSSRVRAYAGGIDLQLGPDELVEQTRRNLCKMVSAPSKSRWGGTSYRKTLSG